MAEYKDVLSLSLGRTPESQLTAGQSSKGRHWNSPRKTPTSKDKGEATMRRQEGHNHSKSKSHNCWVGDSQTREHLYHRSPPTGVKVLSPTSGSQPGGLAMGGGIPRESDFEGQWDLIAGLRQDWGKQRLQSWRAHTKQCVLQDPGEGAVTPGETEPDLPASVAGSPAEAGGGCGSPWGQGHWRQKFWEVLLGVSPCRVCHQPHQRPHEGSSVGLPQGKQPTGREPSPTHQQSSRLKFY